LTKIGNKVDDIECIKVMLKEMLSSCRTSHDSIDASEDPTKKIPEKGYLEVMNLLLDVGQASRHFNEELKEALSSMKNQCP